MRVIANGRYIIRDDETTWPTPMDGDETRESVEWILRHGTPEQVVKFRMLAASIISAYRHMISLPRTQRDQIIRDLRKATRPSPERAEWAQHLPAGAPLE